jgi:hypothetical protein
VFDVLPGKLTPEEYAPKIMEWTSVLSKGAHKIDERDLDGEAPMRNAEKTTEPSENARQF